MFFGYVQSITLHFQYLGFTWTNFIAQHTLYSSVVRQYPCWQTQVLLEGAQFLCMKILLYRLPWPNYLSILLALKIATSSGWLCNWITTLTICACCIVWWRMMNGWDPNGSISRLGYVSTRDVKTQNVGAWINSDMSIPSENVRVAIVLCSLITPLM